MTAMLAILVGQIVAGWLFDRRFTNLGGGTEMAWKAALSPLLLLAGLSIPALAMAIATHLWFFGSLLVRSRIGLLELDGGKDWARTVALEDETEQVHG